MSIGDISKAEEGNSGSTSEKPTLCTSSEVVLLIQKVHRLKI